MFPRNVVEQDPIQSREVLVVREDSLNEGSDNNGVKAIGLTSFPCKIMSVFTDPEEQL